MKQKEFDLSEKIYEVIKWFSFLLLIIIEYLIYFKEPVGLMKTYSISIIACGAIIILFKGNLYGFKLAGEKLK